MDYLLILNHLNEPLLFKSYRNSADDLNIQLHCYACLDFLDERLIAKNNEYLGSIYNVFNVTGEYSIYAFYTVTRVKILAVFKQTIMDKSGLVDKQDDEKVREFFLKVYRLYRRELYQPFANQLAENKFSKRVHKILDLLAKSTVFK